MGRHICVFYDANTKEEVNKTNKKVKVLDTLKFKELLDMIHIEFKCKYIKYIRDLEKNYYTIYNTELVAIEMENNSKISRYD